MKVLIVGYPYVRERYFATFRHWPEPDHIRFLLPRVWTAKKGKVVFHPPTDTNVMTANAYFSHSHYPLIGGLLKGFMPAFATTLWRNRHCVDVVYSCSEPTLLTTVYQACWSKLLGKKHVCFTWENIPYEKKFRGLSRIVHALILRLNLWLSDGLICGNQAGADIHRRSTHKPIIVIPMNGLDMDLFSRRTTGEQTARVSEATVYTFIGAIGERKGIHLMLRAMPQVLAAVPHAHLVIVGNGEYEEQIDALIDELDLHEQVTRLPWVEEKEIVRLLAASDVFVYPSIPHGGWAEQFGYSMAEASLMELPVISTRSGSISDVVIDGQTGILVEPGNIDELAAAMIRLGSDAGFRRQLGQAGRQYIVTHFSHAIIARKFYDFFSSLVKRKNPQA